MEMYILMVYSGLFALGIFTGMFIHERLMRKELRKRAEDGTAEYVGNGEFVYIMKSSDYYRKVLGLRHVQ